MQKSKRQNKTREQLMIELKNNEEFKKKMAFTKEVFYPALTQATTSIDDALSNLSIINTILMEKFLGFMKETKFKDLKIEDNISDEDPKAEDLKAMLALFSDMSAFDAKDLLEGMRNEINLFLQEENKIRTLSELQPKWIDEI
jgi:hypothetical protein